MKHIRWATTAISTWISGLAVLVLGCCILAGWALKNATLIHILPDWGVIVINTALCLSLSGISLLVVPLRRLMPIAVLRHLCIGLVIVLSGLAIVQTAFDLNFGIDLAKYHRHFQRATPYPGRMPLIGAIGFLLFGLASLIHIHKRGPHAARLVRGLTVIVFAIGLLGMMAALLDLQNLYPTLYRNLGIAGLSFHAASGILTLAIGLWGLWYYMLLRGKTGVSEADQDVEVRSIYHSTTAVICVLGLVTGLTGFSFLQKAMQEENAANLLHLLMEKRNYFDTILQFRIQQAAIASDQPELIQAMKTLRLKPNDEAAMTRLRHAAINLRTSEFSGVAIETLGQRMLLSGRLRSISGFNLPLGANYPARLVWQDGHYLQVSYPIHDHITGEIYGSFITEQPLPQIDQSQTETADWGKTGEMIVCSPNGDNMMSCLPHRRVAQPQEALGKRYGIPVPMMQALHQETGSKITFDEDVGRRVIAAYGPIGKTGLGMVVQMEISEIYAPIRSRLEGAVPAIMVLMLLGLWLIHARVRPLVEKLVSVRSAALRERTNFIAAAESAPDAFFILENILGVDGSIVDFKFVYLNQHVKRAFPNVAEDVTGASFLEKFPHRRDFFEKYRQVALSGTILDEEFSWESPEQPPRWINLQVGKMPNGVVVTWRDVTNRKNHDRLLNESNRLRSTIVESAPYSIVTTDLNGTIITFNRASEQLLGYGAEELVGKETPCRFHDPVEIFAQAKALSEELGETIKPDFEVYTVKAKLGLIDEREWTCVRKDGSHVPVRMSITAIRDEQECITGFLGVAQDITEQKRIAEHTLHVSLHDVLTGLPNRALLADRVDLAIKQSCRSGQPFALAILDVDRFKHINDSLGHQVGDQVLVEFVKRITSCVRPTDTVARMGGDEFVIVFPECATCIVEQIFDRILEALRPPMNMDDHDLYVTTSIGISIYPDHGHDMATLMRQADTALYWVKERGRNGYKIFSADIDQGKEDRLRLEGDLHRAAEQGDFDLFYQPMINLRQRKVVGVEALIRWRKADGSYVAPASFIPISEDNGLIVKIGAWVLNQACHDAVRFQQQLQTRLQMSVNVSPRQFVHDDLVDQVRATLQQTGLMPDLLELEITEGILMNQKINVANQLCALNALGVTIAIDDFGTGYSNLSYLKRFPISKIKIDDSFVHDVMTDPENAVLTGAIIAMGHGLNIPVVAEGVETRDQFNFLMRHWCDIGQGYFFAHPMSFDNFIEWYRTHDFNWEIEDLEFVVMD